MLDGSRIESVPTPVTIEETPTISEYPLPCDFNSISAIAPYAVLESVVYSNKDSASL